MSKQDSHFFTIFGLVLGILIAIAIVLFGIARAVGSNRQAAEVFDDPLWAAAVAHRTAPPARVAVAGADNSALEIKAASTAASGPSLPVPADGQALYDAACHACHGAGIGGAPKFGDKAAWAARIAAGQDTLYKHAIEGMSGPAGVMPPKGGRIDLPDELIKQGVDWMIQHSS